MPRPHPAPASTHGTPAAYRYDLLHANGALDVVGLASVALAIVIQEGPGAPGLMLCNDEARW
jgi:hypothetical protein